MKSLFFKVKPDDGLLMFSGWIDPETQKFTPQYEIYQFEGREVRSPLINERPTKL